MWRKELVVITALALLFVVLGLGAPAEAATITINSSADAVADDGACTLREAVTAANTDVASGASAGECAAGSGADTLVTTAALAGATITLNTVGDTTVGPSALRVDTSITLEGGASGLTISRSGPTMRLFYVAAGALVLRDLTLRDGRADGFTGGESQWGGNGGGSAGLGGAIFSDGAVTLERCTLTANEANGGEGGSLRGGGRRGGGGGAGVAGDGSDSPEPPFLNASDGGAGGPSNGGAGGTSASPAGGSGGTGGGGGGAGLSPDTGNSNGGAGGFGGGGGGGSGLGSNPGGAGGVGGFGGGGGGGGKVTHAGPQGVGGVGGFGGGRGADSPSGTGLEGGPGGGGAGLGGAIFARAGSVTTTRSTFQGNIARGGVGGSNSEAQGSPGSGLGGAVFLFTGAQLTATNCTFSGNSASGGGGGVFNYNGIASLVSSTFSGNQAGAGTGGGITNQGDGATANLQLNNTIVANSTGTDVVAVSSAGGTSTTGGNSNLIESQSGFAGGITSTADPGLGSLANNGGLTRTHAIGLTSPALDAGQNAGAPATDQRGRPRVLDGNGDTVATIDIGAYELEVADLRITKTDGVTTAVPGQTTVYTLVASNAGPTAVPSATVTDSFPATLSCSWTSVAAGGATGNTNGSGNLSNTLNLPAGGSVTYTVTCSISPAATGTLSNTATIASSLPDPVPGNNSATDTDTLVPTANLAITKTDGVTTAVPGQTTVYTLVASNAGPSNAPSTTVTDSFPASLTCSWTSVAAGGAIGNTNGSGNLADTLNLPAGGSVTYTATCNIDRAATGTLSNTATITSSATDPVPGNNSATDTDTLVPTADLVITKTDGVTTVVPGQTTVYTLVASNAGPSVDPAVTVTDTFPASLTCSWTSVAAGGASGNTNGSGNLADTLNLPAGGSVTYTATCNIDRAATGTLSNTATITSSATDPVPGNNSATDTDTFAPAADVAITKTDGVTSAVPGDVLTYTLVVSNSGPSAAPDSAVTDTFPVGLGSITWTCVASAGSTCTAAGSGGIADSASLAAGGSVTYTALATVNEGFVGAIVNTATVALTAGVTDPSSANNSATDTTTVSSPALVSGTKEVAGDFLPGEVVTYTITLVNSSTEAQLDNPGDELVDVLPARLTLLAASADSGQVLADLPNNTVRWNGSIPGGGLVHVVIEARIQDNANGVSITNQATLYSDADGDGTNEQTSVTDDPASGGDDDPTVFLVLGTAEIPTLGTWGFLVLALGLGWLGLGKLRLGRLKPSEKLAE